MIMLCYIGIVTIVEYTVRISECEQVPRIIDINVDQTVFAVAHMGDIFLAKCV